MKRRKLEPFGWADLLIWLMIFTAVLALIAFSAMLLREYLHPCIDWAERTQHGHRAIVCTARQ